VTRALDRDGQGALVLRARAGLAARLDLGAVGDHPAQALDILVVRHNLIGGELVDLAAREEAPTATTAAEAPATAAATRTIPTGAIAEATAAATATGAIAEAATAATGTVTKTTAAATGTITKAATSRAIAEATAALRPVVLLVYH
jgi:hypothetical protein